MNQQRCDCHDCTQARERLRIIPGASDPEVRRLPETVTVTQSQVYNALNSVGGTRDADTIKFLRNLGFTTFQ